MNALELRHVSKVRGNGRQAVRALDDASLTLDSEELVLLQGPSGSGKTTLLGLAAGLLTPDSGDVLLEGEALRAGTEQARRRRAGRMGFVFQRSNLLPGLTVRENVLMQAAIAGLSAADAARQTDDLLEALGLTALAGRTTEQLSGGEEQRVAVARALVHCPAVVLADEPTASLDGASGRLVAGQLSSLARRRGCAVLVATHDPRLEPCATRRVRILDGRIEDVRT